MINIWLIKLIASGWFNCLFMGFKTPSQPLESQAPAPEVSAQAPQAPGGGNVRHRKRDNGDVMG